MNFTSFTKQISEKVSKEIGDCYQVRLNDVRKNNGVVLTGLTIIQDESNISPTIYLNHYYEDYINGSTTLTHIVSNVMDTYNKNKVRESVDMRYFLNYEDIKQHVVYKLINTEKNKELLEDIPHIEFLDLSIVFQCLITQKELGTASILIHNTHLRLWDISMDTLYQQAKENTPKLMPYEIKNIAQVLCDILQEENSEQFDHNECVEQSSDSVPMFVLSNKSKIEGAACMLYHNLLCDFAETINSSFYIIPSSIHEVLLLPTEKVKESAEILNMIKEINDTQVSKEEVLSYSLYFYDRQIRKIVQL